MLRLVAEAERHTDHVEAYLDAAEVSTVGWAAQQRLLAGSILQEGGLDFAQVLMDDTEDLVGLRADDGGVV